MKVMGFSVIVVFWLISCNRDTDLIVSPSKNIPAGYPPTLTFSQERYNRFIDLWRQFLYHYNSAYYVPEIDSVRMVPRASRNPSSIPNLDLFPDVIDTVTLQEASGRLIQFLDEWRDLFNISKSEIQITDSNFRQSDNQYAIRISKRISPDRTISSNDRVWVDISKSGVLVNFYTTCTPSVPIPKLANIDSNEAKRAILGKVYYYGFTGGTQLVISDESITRSVLAAIVIPRWSNNSMSIKEIEYRRCWELTAWPFNIYVDAVTGEDVHYEEPLVMF